MKTITQVNWGILGLYALLLTWAILAPSKGQDDAAGRAMAAGYLMIFIIGLVILAGLNLLPYRFPKIVVMVLSGLPLVTGLISLIVSPILSAQRQKRYDGETTGRQNGSYYFTDPVRRQIAAAIAANDTAQLKAALQQPVPNLNESETEHITLLDFATMQAKADQSTKALACLEMLMDKGATIETPDRQRSPTHFMVTEGDPTLLEWFLKKGANPNARDASSGLSLLFAVLFSGNEADYKPRKVTLVLEYGADPNAIPPHDELTIPTSALIYAADNEMWDICQLLLDKGANPKYKTPSGQDMYQVMDYMEKGYTNYGNMPPAGLTALKERLNTLR
jgi:hypothetical protein